MNRKRKKEAQRNPKIASIKNSSRVQGSISVHIKGFGFVKTDEGPDIFIPKHKTLDAVDGDLVEVALLPNPSPKGPEGEVIAILKRGRTHLAGTVLSKSKGHWLAYSPILGQEKWIHLKARGTALVEGDRIVCKVIDWNADTHYISAEFIRRIGHISDPSVDVEAAIEEFGLAYAFSKESLKEADRFGKKVPPSEIEKRLDCTDWECVTIDPDTARDFDDAVSLTKDERGHFFLGVHIADVAHYVRPGAAIDKEASQRCNSTYFPGKCIPMLPENLSNELCSLKPKVVRLTQSLLAEFTPNGDLVKFDVARTAIKSQKRFTYKEALAVIEKKKKSPFLPLLERMVEFCYVLKQKRFERGSIDFAMTENVVIVDDKGMPLRLERVEYDVTHQMIEEFMLKANELVAIHLNNLGKTLIYRIHEEPTSESFNDFYSMARSLGFQLPPKPTHRDIQKLFQDAKDSPLVSQLSVSFIRSMRLAAYSSENMGHYGLALEHYCHFTSPIRRYTDLIIQRLLFESENVTENLEKIAEMASERERVSFRAEKSVVMLKKLRLAATHHNEDPEKVYSAIITKVKPFAFFFEVPAFDLEGSIHVSEIGRDYYEFNPKTMSFRGKRTGKSYTTGQLIYVQLNKIDFILQQAEWSLSPAPPTHAAKKK